MCDSLQPRLQHTRTPCPSPTFRVYSNSCPLSRWCHPTISSSVVPFSSRLQSFPASRSFQMSQFFASGGQNIGVSASTCLSHEYSGLISFRMDWLDLFAVQGTLKSFSNSTVQKHQFFGTQLSSQSNSHIHTWLLEKHAQLIDKFLFRPWHNACGILVPWPGLNLGPSSESAKS